MSDRSVEWTREWHEPGRTRFRVGHAGATMVAEWEGLGTLRVDRSRPEFVVDVDVAAGVDPVLAERWRRGSVEALLRHLHGRPTLHASAVALDGRVVVFVGPSGAGKSTCAADLCQRLHVGLVADDMVELEHRLDRYTVTATETSHWLWTDAATTSGLCGGDPRKVRVSAPQVASNDLPLGAIVGLRFAEHMAAPTLEPLMGRAAFTEISTSFVRFVLDDAATATRDFDEIARIVAAAPVLLLTRPRSFDALPESAVLLSNLLGADGASANLQMDPR